MSEQLRDRRKRPVFIHSSLDEIPLSLEAFRVYCHLARRANDCNQAWPSYRTIGECCFRGSYPDSPSDTLRRKSISAVQELIHWNLISVEERPTVNGGQTSNLYSLTDESEWNRDNLIPSPSARKSRCASSSCHQGSDGGSPGVVMGGHQGSDGGSLKEYSIEVTPLKSYPAEAAPSQVGKFVELQIDLEELKDIEQIAYDWRKQPWMASASKYKPEVIQAVWKCNPGYYSLEGTKTPNIKHITSTLNLLKQKLQQLNAEAITAYTELQNYWTTAQAITNPEIEQAFNHAAIRQKQQQTRSSIEQALQKPIGGIF